MTLLGDHYVICGCIWLLSSRKAVPLRDDRPESPKNFYNFIVRRLWLQYCDNRIFWFWSSFVWDGQKSHSVSQPQHRPSNTNLLRKIPSRGLRLSWFPQNSCGARLRADWWETFSISHFGSPTTLCLWTCISSLRAVAVCVWSFGKRRREATKVVRDPDSIERVNDPVYGKVADELVELNVGDAANKF